MKANSPEPDLDEDDALPSAPDLVSLILEVSEKLDRLLADKEADTSPWLRGDVAAAHYAGFKDKRTFRRWAKKHRLRPRRTGALNMWDKAAIARAHDPNKQPIW